MNAWDTINKVVVVGLGMTGLSVVQHLQRVDKALHIRVIDTRAEPPGREQLPDTVELHAGSWCSEWLLDADLIVSNPGIALATPELRAASQAGVPIVGDIELFAWHCDKPVVAITGSNGKSTVTSLVGEMAKAAGIAVGVGGNIGHAALDLFKQDCDLYVLELSSFQLETTSSLALKAAAYLNLSEDHMDRYDGLADYALAKQRIFANAERAVVNQAESDTWPLDRKVPVVTFGFALSQYGLLTVDGEEWLAAYDKPIMPVADIALVGRHNVANCLAALALADAAGISREGAIAAIRNYTGLPHRCQRVADINGVAWVNDSKATNLASTGAALNGLQLKGRLHLLVGGDGKGADFAELAPILAPLSVTLYCYGRDRQAFADLTPDTIMTETMDEAIAIAAAASASGDMILLSPACASFDQFANFMQRGDHFVALADQYQQRIAS
uniref:UDP-N-acetylmuramoyl-L-alanine--D-glutamate ligase n=1 Tax=Thaumasiovibrio occultus TaxID=1891184 RepID=UPI000B34EF07|nr:UDP-N-acetylmuramoyl-L-alanine--D-glutamate ligase [Thaumasiovibrio occultus]